jgi:uncharacterized protein
MPKVKKRTNSRMIGVIADTHGLVRPEAIEAFQGVGVELIIHAGDVGKPEVFHALQVVAPVVAVRGNTDRGEWAQGLRESEVVHIGPILVYALHDIHNLDADLAAAGYRAVISGHSHQPFAEEREGVLFLNPGSAGPRRFRLPVSVALLRLEKDSLTTRLVLLKA